MPRVLREIKAEAIGGPLPVALGAAPALLLGMLHVDVLLLDVQFLSHTYF